MRAVPRDRAMKLTKPFAVAVVRMEAPPCADYHPKLGAARDRLNKDSSQRCAELGRSERASECSR